MGDEWIKSIYHAAIFGETGAGKTVLANQLHAKGASVGRISFFLNTQEKGYVRGKRIEGGPQEILKGVIDGIKDGTTTFNLVPSSESGAEELQSLSSFLFKLAKDGSRILLTVDEAHDIAKTGTKSSVLHTLHKKGRDPGEGPGGIKMLSLTQSPASLDNDVIRQSKYHVWVGEPNLQEKEYLTSFNFPYEDVMEMNTQDGCMFEESGGEVISHCYTVVKGGKVYDGPKLADPSFAE